MHRLHFIIAHFGITIYLRVTFKDGKTFGILHFALVLVLVLAMVTPLIKQITLSHCPCMIQIITSHSEQEITRLLRLLHCSSNPCYFVVLPQQMISSTQTSCPVGILNQCEEQFI